MVYDELSCVKGEGGVLLGDVSSNQPFKTKMEGLFPKDEPSSFKISKFYNLKIGHLGLLRTVKIKARHIEFFFFLM